jgi:hypothetical protein
MRPMARLTSCSSIVAKLSVMITESDFRPVWSAIGSFYKTVTWLGCPARPGLLLTMATTT